MNKAERQPVPKEPEQGKSAPTTLSLFRYNDVKRDGLRTKYHTALQVEERIKNSKISFEKVFAEKTASLARLDQSSLEFIAELDGIRSSITCGDVFVKMRDELKDLSAQDFMDFFKQCLFINTHLSKSSRENNQNAFLRTISATNARQRDGIVGKVLDNPPPWFRGNKETWKEFAAYHMHFGLYMGVYLPQRESPTTNFNPSSSIQKLKRTIDKPDFQSRVTFEAGFPDWILDNDGEMPTIEQVEKELTEDREQEAKILEGLQKIVNQIIYLDSYISEKGEKSMERLRAFVNEQFADFQNFAELILVLKVFDSENMAETAMDIMQSFTENKNLVVNDEPIALYIEKKLREGKIIDSVQEHITPSLIEVFTSVLEHIKAQKNGNTSKNEFLALKTTNKKAFDALNYGIKPFLEILSLDEISFMQELLKDSNGIPMESFIWDMVSLISLRFENISSLDELSEKQRGAIYYLNKFTTSFLRNHLAWAYEQIRQALHDEDQDKKTTPGSHQQVFEQRTLLPDGLQKEIDDTIEDIQQGNLMGWRIFYADNRSLDSSHVAEIGGKSLTEREQALQEFFVQEGISATIKPGSIIRALEWIVGVPEEVEQVRMTKAIEGKVFKKVKRGKARIFYILDRDQEIIVFFTHQKKDWAYGF